MKKTPVRILLTVSLLALLLSGCGRHSGPAADQPPQTTEVIVTEEPTIPATVPADGNPNDVTCKGTYTGSANPQAVAARIGDATLTNEQLNACYWAEAAAYRQSGEEPAPDWDRPLDTQVCEADSTVASWQQFFLRRALNTWHSAQALILQGNEEGLPVEEAYQPNLDNYEKYMKGMPATKFLYRYQKAFQPNTMHQAYLDAIPETLETLAAGKGYSSASQMAERAFGTTLEGLRTFMENYNRGYMYYTNLSYYIEPTEEELTAALAALTPEQRAADDGCVDIRHILLLPRSVLAEDSEAGEEDPVMVNLDGTVTASEARWEACMAEAEALLQSWAKNPKASDATFAELANKNSQDSGTALDGGAYRRIRRGQLMDVLDSWCFDAERQAGDTVILRSPYGVHILYLSQLHAAGETAAEDICVANGQTDILTVAQSKYPIEIDYPSITLAEAEATVSLGDVLYPDVAHERFPEVPVYLQQDYPGTMYGGFPIRTNGCGITAMSMLATYMADDELTPPEMCARYGRYSFSNGTDGMIFVNEPQAMGFYLHEKTYEPTVAHKALEDGHIVISIQHKGYWTRGGHYIVLEKLNEDGTVQVRDSNIYNYGARVKSHIDDKHTWGSITGAGSGYWIFEDKVTTIPICSRCGDPESLEQTILQEAYICRKCQPALLRRNTYLAN